LPPPLVPPVPPVMPLVPKVPLVMALVLTVLKPNVRGMWPLAVMSPTLGLRPGELRGP